MKRTLYRLTFFLSLILAALLPPQVYASQNSFATDGKAKIKDVLLKNQDTPPSQFGYSIEGPIIPFVGDDVDNIAIAIPDIYPYGVFYTKIADRAVPQNVKKNSINYTNRNVVSAQYCIKMVVTPPYMEKVVKYDLTTKPEVSVDWPDSKIVGQNEEMLASWNGLWKKPTIAHGILFDTGDGTDSILGVTTNDDAYDYNVPTRVITGISAEDCHKQTQPWASVPPTQIGVAQLTEFGAGCPDVNHCSFYKDYYQGPEMWHMELVCDDRDRCHEVKVYDHAGAVIGFSQFTRKSSDGSLTDHQALTGRCHSIDTGDSITTPFGGAGDICDNMGQWTGGFVPLNIRLAPFIPHGQVEQNVRLSGIPQPGIKTLSEKPMKYYTLDSAYKNTHSAQEDTKISTCFNAPLNTQTHLGFGPSVSPIPFADTCVPPLSDEASSSAGGWNCNNVPSSSPLIAAGQAFADSGIFDCADHKENAWKQCAGDVIARATKSCIDPAFALSVWLHESGASNYKCSEAINNGIAVQDFGININSIAENFSKQLDSFLATAKARASECSPPSMLNFWAIYWKGQSKPGGGYKCYDELSQEDQDAVSGDVGYLNEIYHTLTGRDLPTTPVSCGNP